MIAASPEPRTALSFALLSNTHALKLADTDISHLRLTSCYFAMLGVTLFWLVTLTRYAQKPGCLAWCLTFIFISFGLAIRLFTEQVKRTRYPLDYSVSQESRTLAEALTAVYALTSFAICMAFINTQWYKIDRSVLTQQVIEIELSPISPSTPPISSPTPRPATQSVASRVARPVAPPTVQPITRTAQMTPATQLTPAAVRRAEPASSKAIPWTALSSLSSAAHNSTAPVRRVPKVSTGSSFFMEEVPPAQLVEVREVESSTPAALHSQTNSPSPAVNMSILAEYLRELHRVIKASWTPPRNNTRNAEIIFRIKHTGELALVKVVCSSGDINSDESAINAITASAPFKPLPEAYSLTSLDVDYTFNYTTDKLTEIGSGYH